jgi:serine/threonine protein kinase
MTQPTILSLSLSSLTLSLSLMCRWTLLSLWTTKDGEPNTVLFHLAIPLMSAQGFANYFVYVVDKKTLRSVCCCAPRGRSSGVEEEGAPPRKGAVFAVPSFETNVPLSRKQHQTKAWCVCVCVCCTGTYSLRVVCCWCCLLLFVVVVVVVVVVSIGGGILDAASPAQGGAEKARGRMLESHIYRMQCEIDPGELTLGDMIGCGSSADVRRGKLWGTEVAVKIPRANPAMRALTAASASASAQPPPPSFVEMETEIHILSTVANPCVVRFYGVCRVPTGLAIVTELCEGTLQQELVRLKSQVRADTCWAEESCFRLLLLQWMAEIVSGLICLHSKGLIHGDLKPSNILLQQGQAKLCDFGCARSMYASRNSYTGQGTAGYMSPELMEGGERERERDEGAAAALSPKVDVFAFGSTCWSMVELKEPFEEEAPSIFWVRDFLVSGRRLQVANEACPSLLKSLIDACWKHQPGERPSVHELLHTVQQLQGTTRTSASKTHLLHQGPKPSLCAHEDHGSTSNSGSSGLNFGSDSTSPSGSN